MWLFISRRLRAWLLFGVAVPLAAKAVHAAAVKARGTDPRSPVSRTLGGVDSTLRRITDRRSGRRRRTV